MRPCPSLNQRRGLTLATDKANAPGPGLGTGDAMRDASSQDTTTQQCNERERTCVPHVLNPDVCAGSEEEPLYGNKEVTDDVRRHRHAHEEHGKSLQNTNKNNGQYRLYAPKERASGKKVEL